MSCEIAGKQKRPSSLSVVRSMLRPGRRDVSAILLPIIDCMNSRANERPFQQSKVIKCCSNATSNLAGDTSGSALVERYTSRNGWIPLRWRQVRKRNWKSILSILHNHAIRYEWLTFNPISRVRTSSKRLRDKDILTPEEFQRLAEQLSVRDRAIVLLAGSTGLRRSEMIGLTWSDLDTRTMEVNVVRSCVRNRIGKTKTESSRRPVPLHPIVLNALLNWRAESVYAEETDFLFPSIRLKGNRPLSPDSLLKKSIRPALARAGIARGNEKAWSMPTMVGVSPPSSLQSHSARPRRVQYRRGLAGGWTGSGAAEPSAMYTLSPLQLESQVSAPE